MSLLFNRMDVKQRRSYAAWLREHGLREPSQPYRVCPVGVSPFVPRTAENTVVLCFWCRTYHLASEVESCMAIPMKRSTTGQPGASGSSAQPGEHFSSLPELWDFLTRPKDGDGRQRQVASLSLKCEPSGCRLTLNDNHTGQYASLMATSPWEAFQMVELQLAAGEVEWRQSSHNTGKRK
jgi:hypothetical protein